MSKWGLLLCRIGAAEQVLLLRRRSIEADRNDNAHPSAHRAGDARNGNGSRKVLVHAIRVVESGRDRVIQRRRLERQATLSEWQLYAGAWWEAVGRLTAKPAPSRPRVTTPANVRFWEDRTLGLPSPIGRFVPVYATRIDLLFASPSGFAPLVFAPSCVDQCAVPQATLLHRTIMELGAASGR